MHSCSKLLPDVLLGRGSAKFSKPKMSRRPMVLALLLKAS